VTKRARPIGAVTMGPRAAPSPGLLRIPARGLRGNAPAVVALTALLLAGCGKKKDEEQPVPPPPVRGAASSDELNTQVGSARGLDEALAPTSVVWTHVFAIDDKRALITGEVVNATVALLTEDGGATWRSLKSDRDAWSTWAVGAGGAIVLGVGAREGAASPTSAALAGARLTFAAFDAPTLTAPTPLFPTAKGPVEGTLETESAVPAVLGPDSAALIGGETPRKAFVFYGGKPGADAAAPLKLPAGEKIVPVPYGRPPSLLSIKGHDLIERPFPAAGKPLDKPIRVPGLASAPTLLADLSTPPACEAGGWSFQRVRQPKGLAIVGISQEKTVVVPLPEAASPATRVGCSAARVVVEGVAAKTGAPSTWATQPDVPTLLSCDLAGKCVTPQNAPFRFWPEAHKQTLVTTATEAGIVGVMTARAGDRWGLYLAQGPGEGAVYERQRVIGEGTGDRGRVELGALVSFGKRALLLLSADVTGTSRRGWFVMVSDDGGTNWAPP
jgi:hypothetical protein